MSGEDETGNYVLLVGKYIKPIITRLIGVCSVFVAAEYARSDVSH